MIDFKIIFCIFCGYYGNKEDKLLYIINFKKEFILWESRVYGYICKYYML